MCRRYTWGSQVFFFFDKIWWTHQYIACTGLLYLLHVSWWTVYPILSFFCLWSSASLSQLIVVLLAATLLGVFSHPWIILYLVCEIVLFWLSLLLPHYEQQSLVVCNLLLVIDSKILWCRGLSLRGGVGLPLFVPRATFCWEPWWGCKLWYWRFITPPHSFNALLDWQDVRVQCFVGWILLSSQLEGFGDDCELICNQQNFDLISLTVDAYPAHCNKFSDNDGLLSFGCVPEGQIFFPLGTVCDTVFPIALLCCTSLSNDDIGDFSPCMQDITPEMMLGRSWYSIQEVFCGSGNVVSKKVASD